MTMTAPVPSRGPEHRTRRRTAQTVLTIPVLVVLLVPVVYLFGRQWSATGAAADTVTTERATIAYARPLNKLLAALVDAEYAAVRRADVDASPIKAAIEEVNGVDRRLSDPLGVRPRWTGLSHEVDSALSQNATGPAALHAYASAIALTQALLARVADAGKLTGDAGPSSYHLTEVGLENLPEVVVNARQVAALAVATDPPPASARSNPAAARPDPRLTVAADRLTQAADAVRTGLRSGTGQATDSPVDLSLLSPLDEFAAATDDLSQAAAGFDVPGSGARDHVDAASTRVAAAAQALDTAVLNAFDAQLTTRAGGYSTQRRLLVLAGIVIALAVALLLWLRLAGPGERRVRVPEGSDQRLEGRHGYPGGDEAVPDGPQRMPDLVDARELLSPELVPAGRAGVRLRKRPDHDDRRAVGPQ
jgi:hypothetical protein